ncbi:MAG TPA: hypothetical protein VEI82_06720 [Myxococcota bacterium]|nr:hypothetical protein [Myxococcota bacterium]
MAARNSTFDSSRPSPAAPFSDSFALRAAGVLLAICLGLWLAGWKAQGSATAWPRFEDDAYYYLAIARNAASGHGFTADGLSATNGFQPLWMWLLIPLAWLTSGATTPLLAATHLAVVLIFCGSGALLCALLRTRFGLGPALAGTGLLFVPPFLNVLLSGMESGLAVAVFVLLLRELLDSGVLEARAATPRDLRTGVLVGLLLLARLDAVFIALALAGWLALAEWAGAAGTPGARALRVLRKGLAVFWPTLALVVPYLAWNERSFGHLVPISGVLKTDLAAPAFAPGNLSPPYWGLVALALAAQSALRARGGSARVRAVLAALVAGLALQALHAMVFMHWAVFSWHFALFIPIGAFSVAVLASALLERMPADVRPWLGLGLAAGLALAQAISISRLPLAFMGAAGAAGRWVAANLPADAVLAMKDSGAFGYFAERHVINLDGVVNSFEYQERLCRGELAAFLRERGVGYVCQHAVPPEVRGGSYARYVQGYPCHLHGGGGSELTLRRDREVYHGEPYHNYQGQEDQVLIWRIAPEGP